MNPLNHFLLPFNVLLLSFHDSVNIGEIALFSVLFGVLVDADHLYGLIKKKPLHHLRTWIQEPSGLLFIGVPCGIILGALFNPLYVYLTIIPYAMHIILDYMTVHEVSPLDPLSTKSYRTGFIQPAPRNRGSPRTGKISEHYVLALNLLFLVVLLAY